MKSNYFYIAIISGSMILWGLFNYLYHPLMLRYLSIEEFWVFWSLMWLMNLTMVLTTWFMLFLNKEVSKNIDNPSILKLLFVQSLKILLVIWGAISLLFLLSAPLLQIYLWIDKIWYFLFIAASMLVSFLAAPIMAFLRGLKKFEFLWIYQAFLPLLKLILWLVFAVLTFKIYGALLWVFLSGFVGFFIAGTYILILLRDVKSDEKNFSLLQDFYKQKSEIFSYFTLSFFLAIFMNIDVILAKNIFSPEDAWVYAWVAILWKFLVFLLISIETVYYSQILEHTWKWVPKQLIRNPLILIGIWAIWAIIINIFIGKYILGIMKAELVEYVWIYILSLIFYGLLAYTNFFAKVLIARKVVSTNYILAFFSVLLLIFSYTFNNSSLEYYLYSFIWVVVLLNTVLTFLFFKSIKRV